MMRSVKSFLIVLLSFMCLIVLTSVSSSQKKTEESPSLFRIEQNKKYGFIDRMGKIVIKPQYDYAGSFSEGLACVEIDEKYGYIDKMGKVVIEPEFDSADSFSEGLACVEIDEKHGYIDKMGKVVIEPEFDSADSFSEGLACVEIDEKHGYIDKTGKVIIEPEFDSADSFSEGLACVKIDEKHGYIDKTGKVIIEPEFDSADSFSEGLACVKIDERRGSGYIGKTGEVVIEPQFACGEPFSEGLALAASGAIGKTSHFAKGIVTRQTLGLETSYSKVWFVDKTGKKAIDLQIHEVKDALVPGFSEGLAGVNIGDKWGFIDKTGKIVIEPSFDTAWGFLEGLAHVEIAGEYGYIDKTGKYVWGFTTAQIEEETYITEITLYDEYSRPAFVVLQNVEGKEIAKRERVFSQYNSQFIDSEKTLDCTTGETIHMTDYDIYGKPKNHMWLCLDKEGNIIREAGEPVLVKPFAARQESRSENEYDGGFISRTVTKNYPCKGCAEKTGVRNCRYVW